MREDWDLPRLTAWNKYSEQHPPVHQLVAAYLGYKAPAHASNTEEAATDALAFLSSIPELSKK